MEVGPSIKTYANLGEHAFGSIGKIIVSIILYNDRYMVDTGFLILEGDNLHSLFPEVAIQVCGITIGGKSSFIIIISLVLLPSVWLDNLSILAYISASFVLALFLILGSVFWVGAFDGVGFHFHPRGSLLNLKGIPTAICLCMLCYASHPVIPALYTSMKKKKKKAAFLQGVVTVLFHIHYHLRLDGSSRPVVISTESWFRIDYQKKQQLKIFIRTALVAAQVIVALALPFLGHLMSLVGALLSATASLAIPCLRYLKISRLSKLKLGDHERLLICSIVILNVIFIVVFGTYASLLDIFVCLIN
ncbi:hypothetical protein Cgig2_019483 [Carnegiea gigantea]|uniref:Amino acid transporter transmembrane domain-containing protein n=1 Tax=Carnegiea gigantea TaxID=171969 RepID=A0A9Q1KRA1_9CARY|nr:hypothetical protein Cgig2_019483 [Carnegiea gigantea]